MTDIKLDTKLGGGPAASLQPLVPALFGRPGVRIVGIVELMHIERTEPAPDTDGKATVKMRISALEIAGKEQEGAIREAQRALYLQRTAAGTLEESGQMVLTERTLKLTAGVLTEIESARLRAGLQHWANYARAASRTSNLTHSEVLHELQAVAEGLDSVLGWADLGDD